MSTSLRIASLDKDSSRRTRISACNAARGRNSPTIAHQMNPMTSPIRLIINRLTG
jgi:hypothetical protein